MRGEQRVSWASRTDSPQHRSAVQTPRDSSTARQPRDTYFSPSEQRYGDSPFPMSPETQAQLSAAPLLRHGEQQQQPERDIASAPAEMLQPHRALSSLSQPVDPHAATFDGHSVRPVAPIIASHRQVSQPETIELDRTAPFRAMRDPRADVDTLRNAEEGQLQTVTEEDERLQPQPADAAGKGKAVDRPGQGQSPTEERLPDDSPVPRPQPQEEGPVWGESFKVEWVRTERLPFTRTRHLRNPWNHDREVKVSRDGTELEPSVGQALLEEWDKLDEPQPQTPATATAPNVDVGRRLPGKASVSVDVLSTPDSHAAGTGKAGGGS